MRYFTVEKEVMRVAPVRFGVASDGTQSADEWETDYEQEITTGFVVNIYDDDSEMMISDCSFYPVQTDMENFENNEDKVLEQIKHDFPAPEWQNDEW